MRHVLTVLLLFVSVAFAQFPWSGTAPKEIEQAALSPDCVLDETPCNWRPALEAIFRPLVKECRTASEAVLTVASQMTQATGVYYSPKRRHPLMNPLEALHEKKVSCTGQSILLVSALRSIGIPARAVGIGSWGYIRGNHTWCEAWCDGEWKMIEFNEKDFNTPWVMEYIGMINPKVPHQRIFAASPHGRGGYFPTVWNFESRVTAEDVTQRYLALSRAWYEKKGLPTDCQRLMVDIHPRLEEECILTLENEQGAPIETAPLPTLRDDMRRTAILNLPRQGCYYLRIEGSEQRIELTPTPAPVQLLQIQR